MIRRIFGLATLILVIALCVPIKEAPWMMTFQDQARSKVQALAANSSVNNETLQVPDKQDFAVRNIQMNMSKSQVEKQLGKPKRVTANEYGLKWYTYHNNYHSFVMVSYIGDKVNAMYTNQNIISSKSKIKYGTPKEAVRNRMGKPLKFLSKGNYRFELDNDEYDVFDKKNIYTTVFYDQHEKNQVKGLLQVSKTMENRLTAQYGAPSSSLKNGLELQDFDLVNAERVQKGKAILSYSSTLSHTARKHSQDMASHHFFDHTNLKGESPFDRMKKDGIKYQSAGENLAYGQQNSIFAHEGLMNSAGHRKNILHNNFNHLGVGVDFNTNRQPYWTENYTS